MTFVTRHQYRVDGLGVHPGTHQRFALFAMTAQVVVPPGRAGTDWEAGLEEIGGRLNLDIRVSPDPCPRGAVPMRMPGTSP